MEQNLIHIEEDNLKILIRAMGVFKIGFMFQFRKFKAI